VISADGSVSTDQKFAQATDRETIARPPGISPPSLRTANPRHAAGHEPSGGGAPSALAVMTSITMSAEARLMTTLPGGGVGDHAADAGFVGSPATIGLALHLGRAAATLGGIRRCSRRPKMMTSEQGW
jgi:hypothetical protein